jgi:DNA-binding transcriptional MerR regulator
MTGDAPLRIGALARLAGVSPDTLRHYERRGLLRPAGRSHAGYRLYDPAAARRVLTIRSALDVGFSLADLGSVLKERERGGAPCGRVRRLVEDRLRDLDARLTYLSAVRQSMRQVLDAWDRRLAATPAGQRAHLLDMLAEAGQRAVPVRPLVAASGPDHRLRVQARRAKGRHETGGAGHERRR